MAGEVKPFIARSRCRVGLVGVLGPIVQIVRSTVPRAGYQPSVGDTVAGQAVSDQHLWHAYEVIANLKYSERARISPKFQATSCATATLRIYTTTSLVLLRRSTKRYRKGHHAATAHSRT